MRTTGETDGLLGAYAFDGHGGAAELEWEDLAKTIAGPTPVWILLKRDVEAAARWLRLESGLSQIVCEALLAEDTRPRSTALDGGELVILRGVNLNPGADPEDMVSLRMWFNETSLISVRVRKIVALKELLGEIESGRGPTSCGETVAAIANRLVERMDPVIGDLGDEVDALEDRVLGDPSNEVRQELSALRRQAILLRRYIAPQREALARLASDQTAALDGTCRVRVREAADRIIRYVEDLDAVRERAAIIHEQLTGQIAEEMNRTMYVLSVVAALFLPLGFLTGLLGINVGGIPGAENPEAFLIFLGLLGGLVVVQLVLFRFLKIL